jgi:ABC-2 type transport system permease protein
MMQPDSTMTSPTRGIIARVAAKEVALFFASPIAYLFLGSFAAVTLFVFFWGEAFFSRNIVDVRPLFEWMPVLLIFLSATLTMRLWSEERRSGTLEYLHTQAVPMWHFILGKFVACLFLLVLALAITLPLPLSVAWIGDLDWGPVWSGYLAALLLGGAYLSIGLFVSARSDNQIVSLISATLLCGLFYLLGTATLTDFFGNEAGEWLRLLGTGSRFEAIVRGVIDFRDFYYYLSIIAVFLVLNTLVLERARWAVGGSSPRHRRWRVLTALLVVNVLGANLWVGQLSGLRADVTEGRQYSISAATRAYIGQLREPLLLRGYFSSKTHPLLAPLVPQLQDLLSEYAIAGDGRIRVEFVDPPNEPELEEEANRKYGIQPVPFQVADRYQSAIVSSYFNVLVQYGDEYEVFGFSDLIEVQARGEGDIEVQLRNAEYDLTRAIKRVLNNYQAGGNLFETVQGELVFRAYVSADAALPEELNSFKKAIIPVLEEVRAGSSGRLRVEFLEPEAGDGALARQIGDDYGFMPMSAGLFSDQQFYFYMTLHRVADGKEGGVVQLPLDDLGGESFARNLDAGIKRFAGGFTKTVALVAPEAGGQAYAPSGPLFNELEGFLATELNVEPEELSDGTVSGEADILVLAAPQGLDDSELFAVDQFLMQGGTVILATSPFASSLSNQGLNMNRQTSGLEDWLAHNGLRVVEQLVLDPRNTAFPLPVTRNVGGFQMQEIRMLDYPYFINVRDEGLDGDNPISSQLPEVTVAWASPIEVDREQQSQRHVIELLRSSDQAWRSDSLDILPEISAEGIGRFEPENERGSELLGVITQGKFSSYFAGKPSPLLSPPEQAAEQVADSEAATESTSRDLQLSPVIERSPESARIILFSSNDLFSDQMLGLSSAVSQTRHLNSLQLLVNAVDWSLEDAGLLSIRSRGYFDRTLPPLDRGEQMFWEYLNYGLAVGVLMMIAIIERRRRRRKQLGYLALYGN